MPEAGDEIEEAVGRSERMRHLSGRVLIFVTPYAGEIH